MITNKSNKEPVTKLVFLRHGESVKNVKVLDDISLESFVNKKFL